MNWTRFRNSVINGDCSSEYPESPIHDCSLIKKIDPAVGRLLESNRKPVSINLYQILKLKELLSIFDQEISHKYGRHVKQFESIECLRIKAMKLVNTIRWKTICGTIPTVRRKIYKAFKPRIRSLAKITWPILRMFVL